MVDSKNTQDTLPHNDWFPTSRAVALEPGCAVGNKIYLAAQFVPNVAFQIEEFFSPRNDNLIIFRKLILFLHP